MLFPLPLPPVHGLRELARVAGQGLEFFQFSLPSNRAVQRLSMSLAFFDSTSCAGMLSSSVFRTLLRPARSRWQHIPKASGVDDLRRCFRQALFGAPGDSRPGRQQHLDRSGTQAMKSPTAKAPAAERRLSCQSCRLASQGANSGVCAVAAGADLASSAGAVLSAWVTPNIGFVSTGMVPWIGFYSVLPLGAVSSLMWPAAAHLLAGVGAGTTGVARLMAATLGLGRGRSGIRLVPALFFHWQLAWLTQLGRTPSGQPVVQHTITGQVTALSVKPMTYLVLQLTSLNGRALTPQPLVRVSWYGKQKVPGLGSEVAGKIRLKPAHGLANPGGFVLERWLLGAGISATGSVSSLQLVRAPTELPWRERWLQDFF